MDWSLRWRPYDPSWLVSLARQQYEEDPTVADALLRCSTAANVSQAYTYFVDPEKANRPGADWQFLKNVVLDDGSGNSVVLDVLQDGRIGGVEFLTYALRRTN